jgi:hypothetical protein
MDKRTDRVQPIRLSSESFPLDIHKSMFINDLTITIPSSYVKMWGESIISKHNENNRLWELSIDYEAPKEMGRQKFSFNAKLTLSFIKNRNKESSYRLKWDNDFAVQLAKDYPKSFVRALEFHIGDEYYKTIKYTEFDIGGFKEQLQVKIYWENDLPIVKIKELFRVREEEQGFPEVFKQLSSYLIADYLLSSDEELLRRIQITEWKKRSEITKELNENNIYILLNRSKKEIYFGETKQSLSKRYPINQKHHSFDEWDEYSIIQLPPETSDHARILIERVVIAIGAKLFPNELTKELTVFDSSIGLKLKNRKK